MHNLSQHSKSYSQINNGSVPEGHTFVEAKKEQRKNDENNMQMDSPNVDSRYNITDPFHVITPQSIAYKIWLFRYVPRLKKYVISSLFYDEVRCILHEAGFSKRKIGKDFFYIQKKGAVISEVSPQIMRNYLIKYIDSNVENAIFSYKGVKYVIPPEALRETFFNNSNNIFNKVWLEHLQIHDEPVLKDTKNEMFFVFKNVLVTVSKEGGITTGDINDKIGFCVWEDQIIQYDYTYNEDCTNSHFYKFITNVTKDDSNRFLSITTGIGYLLHHHFNQAEGQAVIFYDEEMADPDSPMGGSGKGLILNAIGQVRKVAKVDGKHLDGGNRFVWERVTPSTQVVWLDDVKPVFDFSILHSNLTDGWTVERKFLPQFMIPAEDSPKTVICSNSIIKGGGTTNKRRQFVIELSDFYSSKIKKGDEKPIEQIHGCIFFDKSAWNQGEWNKFFTVMFDFAHIYLNRGLVGFEGVNHAFNQLVADTDSDFADWVLNQNFGSSYYPTKGYYNNFTNLYHEKGHRFEQRRFTNYIKKFANFREWKFEVVQMNGISYFHFPSI